MTIPKKCGRDDLSLLLGVSARRVSQLVDKKILVQEARGTFDVLDCVHKFIAYRETCVAKEHGLGAYGQARAKVYVERAKMMQLKREELEGSLARVDDFQTAAGALMTVFRNQMLGLAAKLAAQLAAIRTPAEAQKLLYGEIHENLLELSQNRNHRQQRRQGT